MESEDDMHDANEVASVEEDDNYYSGGENDDDMDEAAEDSDYGYGYVDEDDDGAADYDFMANSDDGDDALVSRSQKNYTILKEEDIQQRQFEDITKISTVLSIPREAACILLRRYNWSVNNVHEEWFADEENVRRAVGILEKPVIKSTSFKEVSCRICFENYSIDNLRTVACTHLFCDTCWKAYISTSINDGPGCLVLRCPDPSCGAAVGQDMIDKLASHEDKEKYRRYLLRSYVEDSRKIKWCPAPGCESAVEFVVGSGSYDVTCSCSYSFCWNCAEEAHRPVDCETVAKWVLKNSAESENMNWILANSKPCPKCKRPIEKNQGCMHMTCTPPCKFEFCWLCLGQWSEHGERTGGFYACNRYEAAKQEGVYDESERRREMAKNSLERYTHYYERWASNQSSRQKALSDLHQMQSVHLLGMLSFWREVAKYIPPHSTGSRVTVLAARNKKRDIFVKKLEKLSEVQSQPESQLKFIIEAWQQTVECRRVLKWTYAYGYYLPETEQTKKQFFEYLQGEAEAGLERLHQCAEKELMNYLNSDGPSKDFNDFRTKLAGLTSVTRNYFENLVRALENGLSDVDSQAVIFNKMIAKTVAGPSKTKGGRGKGSSKTSTSVRNAEDPGIWACNKCTYVNPRSEASCLVCGYRG